MIEKTYKLHMHQKWFLGESNTVTHRTFIGKDQADIDRQIYDSQDRLLEDTAVLIAWYEEVQK